jgi:imidazolonepropionase-like amidohydrolase
VPLYPPDGIPYYLSDLPPEIRKIIPQPTTPAAAVGFVDDDLAGGADIIKLFTGSWIARGKVKPMPVDVATAAVEEAHKHGKLVFTHPSNVAGLEVALAAHVDVLAHSIEDMHGWNSSYLTRMKAANMTLIPTLKLFGSDDDLPGILDEVGSYQRMGGQILFGTDVGYLPDYDPSNEYSLMSRAGLTPMQILASLTTAPADRFSESASRGRVAAGMPADLVVLSADPATDAANFAKVRHTVRGGRIVYSASAN